MAIHSFIDHEAEAFFHRGSRPRKKGWDSAREIVRRKLDMLHYAKELKDLLEPISVKFFVDFLDYFGRFLIEKHRVIYED